MTSARSGTPSAAWCFAAGAAALLVAFYVRGRLNVEGIGGRWVFFAATMGFGMCVGLWAWWARPLTRIGVLMFAWPALWLAGDLPASFPDSRLASTIGVALFVMGPIAFAQTALSYPTGRLMRGALAWIFVFVLGYAAQAVQNAYNLLYLDLSGCPPCPPPRVPTWFHVSGIPPISLQSWNDAWLVFVLAILPIGLFLLYRAYVQASPANRRSLAPVLLTATFITCTSWVSGYAALTDRFSVLTPISWLQTAGALVASSTALIGLLVTSHARGPVGTLVVELDRVGPGGVRAALARAIGDPTLQLALWLSDRGVWADEDGHELALVSGPGRAVTLVGTDLAAMIHDPVLLDQPGLLEAAGSAARLALENERLQVELRHQLAELRESRARIVHAGDVERRKLERDLHDGVQQRLLGIGMGLRLLESQKTDPAAAGAILELQCEVRATIEELRDLARGIHSPVLSDQGLAAALETLADRSSIPVAVAAPAARLPLHIETAVYYFAAESLANVEKHAHASRARVTVSRRAEAVVASVEDDGVGGARLDGDGSGLRGLLDRIGAVDGRLRITSDEHGTRLEAEIPCAS